MPETTSDGPDFTWSVVIPGHDKAKPIASRMKSPCNGTDAVECQVVAVCNGSFDGLGFVARNTGHPVPLPELLVDSDETPSRTGDRAATALRRVYLGAGIVLAGASVYALVEGDGAVAAYQPISEIVGRVPSARGPTFAANWTRATE